MDALPESLILFLASLVGTVIAGKLFSWAVRRTLGRVNKVLGDALARFGSWGIYLTGFLFSLEHLNLRLEVLLILFGALAAMLLLGLKDVLPNVVARHMLEIYRPFKVGDWIEVDGNVGRVVDIDDLYTVILTVYHERVYIPNTALLKKQVVNITRSEGVDVVTSFEVPVTGDIGKLISRLEKTLKKELEEEVMEGEPEVWLSGISGGKARLTVRTRIGNPNRVPEVRSKILLSVAKVISEPG
ncbi:mechanosensitive ion channel domain-containing protein [Infirmifilum sp. SLHALR2]